MRIAIDTGLPIPDSTDAAAANRARDQARVRAVLQMNMGSAMGMANAGELLFREALPPCSHWGDRVMQQFAARGFDSVPMPSLGGLSVDARPTVPSPFQVTSPGEHVGPHGSPTALKQSELPICSYAQIVEEARAEAANAKVPTAAAGVSMGDRLVGDGDEGALDLMAAEEDGKRVWPPAVFQSTAAAKEATEITLAIGNHVASLGVKDELLSCVPGVYASVIEFVLVGKELSPAHRDAYAALGLGALDGQRDSIAHARSMAHMLSAMGFATGHSDLGDAFRDLAAGPMSRFARKPWA